MKKTVSFFILSTVMAILLFGCGCEHEWIEANCSAPKTCSLCGKTEGGPGEHIWNGPNCENPEICTVCGTVEGEALGHDWIKATCTEPKICAVCGKAEGTAIGHEWVGATCTMPVVCKVCGETSGEPLDHTWSDATCTKPTTCDVCGLTAGGALGHRVETWKTTQEATCTQTGVATGICIVCGESIENVIEMRDHTPGDWVVTELPAINKKGTHVKSCSVCGKELEKEQFSMSAEEIEKLYKNRCKSVSYTSLARNPDDYKGEYVKFRGKVVQVCSEATSSDYYSTYRVATSGSYNNVVYVLIDNYDSGTRILEDDWIAIYGVFDGIYTYETVMGSTMSIPKIYVEYYD